VTRILGGYESPEGSVRARAHFNADLERLRRRLLLRADEVIG